MLVGWFPAIGNPLLCASSCSLWDSVDRFSPSKRGKLLFLDEQTKARFAFICEKCILYSQASAYAIAL